ncbi:MAG TPA: hypothetical protein VKP30_15600, partial [Polyangiaceae bacterium]|nr:hypothetical protein [Polyangiaceae bacterium]
MAHEEWKVGRLYAAAVSTDPLAARGGLFAALLKRVAESPCQSSVSARAVHVLRDGAFVACEAGVSTSRPRY